MIRVYKLYEQEKNKSIQDQNKQITKFAEKDPKVVTTEGQIKSIETCESDPFARTLLYLEMPRYYTWNAASKKFQCRKNRKKDDAVAGFADVYSSDALGRIYTGSDILQFPAYCGWCTVRHFSGSLSTLEFARKRFKLGLNTRRCNYFCASKSRTLFMIIIATCHPSNPTALWEKYKDEIVDDILHRVRMTNLNFDLESNDEMRNEALVLIEDMCVLMCGSLLSTLGMPAPNRSTHAAFNLELQREKNYDRDERVKRVRKNVPLLNAEQKNVYNSLMKVVDHGTGGIYFLDAPGGTGKTFVISLILATIRSRSQIALAVASSGIAATLLERGRTAHSTLKLPMNLLTVDKPTCRTTKNSTTAKLM
ncbi:ATP-dependent DNA helicase [Aphis craccivora]|uniref:ATP-dependent DNA helicase n=1 Tax=Aphis craccivora TaxID=307492 RepID=A0A6G0VX55_APHCR|nr:ATP-dependent DNA helicase [Aphis craccivora]